MKIVEAQTDRNLDLGIDQEQKTIDENLQETRQRDEREARGWWSCRMFVAGRRDEQRPPPTLRTQSRPSQALLKHKT